MDWVALFHRLCASSACASDRCDSLDALHTPDLPEVQGSLDSPCLRRAKATQHKKSYTKQHHPTDRSRDHLAIPSLGGCGQMNPILPKDGALKNMEKHSEQARVLTSSEQEPLPEPNGCEKFPPVSEHNHVYRG